MKSWIFKYYSKKKVNAPYFFTINVGYSTFFEGTRPRRLKNVIYIQKMNSKNDVQNNRRSSIPFDVIVVNLQSLYVLVSKKRYEPEECHFVWCELSSIITVLVEYLTPMLTML